MCVDARSLKKCAEFSVGVCVVGGSVLWGGVFGWSGWDLLDEGVSTAVIWVVVVGWELGDWVGGVAEFVGRSWR